MRHCRRMKVCKKPSSCRFVSFANGKHWLLCFNRFIRFIRRNLIWNQFQMRTIFCQSNSLPNSQIPFHGFHMFGCQHIVLNHSPHSQITMTASNNTCAKQKSDETKPHCTLCVCVCQCFPTRIERTKSAGRQTYAKHVNCVDIIENVLELNKCFHQNDWAKHLIIATNKLLNIVEVFQRQLKEIPYREYVPTKRTVNILLTVYI